MRAIMHALISLLWILALAILGIELLTYAIRRYEIVNSGEPPVMDRGALNACSAFFAQCLAVYATMLGAPLAFWWPFSRSRPGAQSPVVLVHGYLGTRAAFFWLAWRLRHDGFGTIAAVNYRSMGGDLQTAARKLAATVERLAAESGAERVNIVTHSLGGLVARAYIREPGSPSRVGRLVTLGAPHQGTKLAGLSFDSLGRSILPGSPLLAELSANDPVPGAVSVTSIFSTFDAKVLPWRNGYYPGAENIEIAGIGHDALLFSPKVYALVAESLADQTRSDSLDSPRR